MCTLNWDSQQGRVRTTSILVRAFWNFKLKVLKYTRNCSLHNTLIPWSLKNPELTNLQTTYRITTNIFRRNYSFLNKKIVENSNSCRKFHFFTFFDPLINLAWSFRGYNEVVHEPRTLFYPFCVTSNTLCMYLFKCIYF